MWGYAVNKDSKRWIIHALENPPYQDLMESKLPQEESQELPAYAVISSLHIKLNSHKTMMT